MNTNDKLRELIRSPLSTAVEVTQADRDAAMALLNHAFRNAPDECTQDVEFDDIAAAFAHDRQQAVTPLEAERASVLQNKRVNDAIQTAFEKGELILSSDGYCSPPKHEGGRGEPVALLHEHPNGDRELELYRFGAGCLTNADKAAGWTETPLYAHPPATRPAALGEDADNKASGLWYSRWRKAQDHIAALEADITCRREDRFEMALRITQQAEEVARLRRIVKGWADWYRLADGDLDCEYLNGKGWDDAEALADMSLAVLRALNEQPDGEGAE